MKNDAKVFMILSYMKVESKVFICELLVVCYFLKVFLDDISDFPSEHEVEFPIDLVYGITPMLMATYRMSVSKLMELKK